MGGGARRRVASSTSISIPDLGSLASSPISHPTTSGGGVVATTTVVVRSSRAATISLLDRSGNLFPKEAKHLELGLSEVSFEND